MNVGFIGLGAVVETAYLPALRQTGANCYGFDLRLDRQPEGIIRCSMLSTLLDSPLETLFITTSSLHHLEVLEQALASPIPPYRGGKTDYCDPRSGHPVKRAVERLPGRPPGAGP